uniref:Uncharacterized protein n=1 Tax=Dicentrarchus labrax TaxID=13489 RepID=A0A8C4E8U2_DICLA
SSCYSVFEMAGGLIPWLGHVLEFPKDTIKFLERMKKKHGDVLMVQLGGFYITFPQDPLSLGAFVKETPEKLDFNLFARNLVQQLFGYRSIGNEKQILMTTSHKHLRGAGLEVLTRAMMCNLQNVMLQNIVSSADQTNWVEDRYSCTSEGSTEKAKEKDLTGSRERGGKQGSEGIWPGSPTWWPFDPPDLPFDPLLHCSFVTAVLQDMTFEMADGCEYHIRKGDRMAVFPYSAFHTNPEIHPDPHSIKYDCFLNPDGSKKTDFYKAGTKVKYYNMPFGAGVSMYPGRFFANNELKQFVFLMLVYFEFELKNPDEKIPDTDVNRLGFGALHPIRDIQFQYRLRF